MIQNDLFFETNANKRTFYTLLFILVAFSIALYGKGITPSFSSDDYIHIEKNISFKHAIQALSVFTEFDGREYRPLVRFTLWANSKMSASALSFHATNVLLHMLCTLLVFCISLSLTRNLNHSFAGSILFAQLPIHSASINFIMGRTDLLCALFYLLSFWLFQIHLQKKNSRVLYFISNISFLIAVSSKEIAVSLPFLISVLVFLKSKKKNTVKRLVESIKTTIPFWLISIIYIFIRILSWAGNAQSVAVYTNYSVKHVAKNFLMWFFALIYPFDLYKARTFSENNLLLFSSFLLFCSGLILLFIVCIIGKNKVLVFVKNRYFILGITWFIVTLSPVMGAGAHRWYLYLPSVSLSFIVLSLLDTVQEKWQKTLCVVLVIYLFLACVQTLHRTHIWSKQDLISQKFFDQIEKHGIQDLQKCYFINIPFGYKNAYLYTFQSLESALFLKYGKKPEIIEVSHLNLSDKDNLKVEKSPGKLKFQLAIDDYSFFYFNFITRNFPEPTQFNTGDLSVAINSVSKSKLVESYVVNIPDDLKVPIYYFDAKNIVKW
jgi:protein O-mannosyl-transferase